MTMSASLACAALITRYVQSLNLGARYLFTDTPFSKPSELSSPRADVIRRVFWHCSMVET